MDLEVKLLRLPDIARLVSDNMIHLGIASDEWIIETQSEAVRVAPLCWYQADICLAAPNPPAGAKSLKEFIAKKNRPIHVATQYPNLTTLYFQRLGVDYKLRTVAGSAEAYPPEFADVILDCVETGKTLSENGLRVIDVVVQSCVHVIVAPKVMWEPRLRELVRPIVDILKTTAVAGCSRHKTVSSQPPFVVRQTA